MAVTINAKGTAFPSFQIGKKGATLFQGDTDITPLQVGDFLFNTVTGSIMYNGSSGWQPLSFGDISISGNTITSTTDLNLSPTGDLVLKDVVWPDGTGLANQVLTSAGDGTAYWSSAPSPFTIGDGLALATGVLSHADTSTLTDTANTGANVIQNMSFDSFGFGHVSGVSTIDLDTLYERIPNAAAKYVAKSGDTMTGALMVDLSTAQADPNNAVEYIFKNRRSVSGDDIVVLAVYDVVTAIMAPGQAGAGLTMHTGGKSNASGLFQVENDHHMLVLKSPNSPYDSVHQLSTDPVQGAIIGTALQVNGDIDAVGFSVIANSFLGNASTATKWATGRALTIGDASKTVDGTADVGWTLEEIGAQPVLGFIPENVANKNVADGYAGLDSTGKILSNLLPAIAITNTFIVANETEMLALTADVGDVAVRTDINKSFILAVAGADVMANWQELLTPTDAVLSVAGKTGIVTLVPSDVGAQPVDATLTAMAGVVTAADRIIYFNGVDTAAATPLSAFGRTLIDDADASAARTTIGAQAADATLTAMAGVVTAADRIIYFNGVDTAAATPLTAFGRTLIDDVDASAARTTIGAQAADATLTAIAGVVTAADQIIYFNGVDTAAATPLTAFGRTLIDDVDATAARTTIGAAATVHSHAIADVTGLQAALDALDASTAVVIISDTKPTTTEHGALWYDSLGGRLYVYYVDIDSGQWVEASPQSSPNMAGGDSGLRDDLALPTGAGLVGTTQGITVQASLDGKAAIDHTHTAAQINAVSTSGDTMSGALQVDLTNAVLVDDVEYRFKNRRTVSDDDIIVHAVYDVVTAIMVPGQAGAGLIMHTGGKTNASGLFQVENDHHMFILKSPTSPYDTVHQFSTDPVQGVIIGTDMQIDGNLDVTGYSITADSFIGTVSNAATADAWSSPITLTLDGDATGSVELDGSGDVTLSVTMAGMVQMSDTAPVGAVNGSLWYNTSEGIPYVLYEDADSTQWVEFVPPSVAASNAMLMETVKKLTEEINLLKSKVASLEGGK